MKSGSWPGKGKLLCQTSSAWQLRRLSHHAKWVLREVSPIHSSFCLLYSSLNSSLPEEHWAWEIHKKRTMYPPMDKLVLWTQLALRLWNNLIWSYPQDPKWTYNGNDVFFHKAKIPDAFWVLQGKKKKKPQTFMTFITMESTSISSADRSYSIHTRY